MQLSFRRLLNYIPILQVFRLTILVSVIFASVGISGCNAIHVADATIQNDSSNINLVNSDSNESESKDSGALPNISNEVLTSSIKEFEFLGKMALVLPINDFTYELGGQHYIFYIADKQSGVIKLMLDNPSSLKEKYLKIFLTNIHILDLNNDRLEDLLIEFHYPVGSGKFAGVDKNIYEVYLQTDKENGYFIYKSKLSKYINEIVEKETILYIEEDKDHYIPDIDFVIDLIKENNKD